MPVALSELLTVQDVARIFRWSTPNVYIRVARGHLPAVRVGRSLRFRAEDLQRVLKPSSRRMRP